MLINLTNHPHHQWSPEQLQAAKTIYGSVIDIAFPSINPGASTEEVNELAYVYFNKLVTASGAQPFAVHLSGEFTFVYHLLVLLKEAGIPAITSTSERMVTTGENGTKTVQFRFVRFRQYFTL